MAGNEYLTQLSKASGVSERDVAKVLDALRETSAAVGGRSETGKLFSLNFVKIGRLIVAV